MDMLQSAPWPNDLADLVDSLDYKPGWKFYLLGSSRPDGVQGLHLFIVAELPDAVNGGMTKIAFPFSVPAVVRSREGWRDWLWECIADADRHERGEWFRIDGERPYAPKHIPEADGYGRHS